ncbi:MAG: hypothetical protein H0X51_09145 [Parachlamydiaceae bacterium]|nr:hypothetical protein [Parachlamydiaceae bacterium]
MDPSISRTLGRYTAALTALDQTSRDVRPKGRCVPCTWLCNALRALVARIVTLVQRCCKRNTVQIPRSTDLDHKLSEVKQLVDAAKPRFEALLKERERAESLKKKSPADLVDMFLQRMSSPEQEANIKPVLNDIYSLFLDSTDYDAPLSPRFNEPLQKRLSALTFDQLEVLNNAITNDSNLNLPMRLDDTRKKVRESVYAAGAQLIFKTPDFLKNVPDDSLIFFRHVMQSLSRQITPEECGLLPKQFATLSYPSTLEHAALIEALPANLKYAYLEQLPEKDLEALLCIDPHPFKGLRNMKYSDHLEVLYFALNHLFSKVQNGSISAESFTRIQKNLNDQWNQEYDSARTHLASLFNHSHVRGKLLQLFQMTPPKSEESKDTKA